MASAKDAERIATILARAAQTDNENEAFVSIKSAHARMKRDGITLDDLLALPDIKLYQQGLMDLVRYSVSQESDLSEPAKRELYAKLVAKVSRRFDSQSTHENPHHSGEDRSHDNRRDHERTAGQGSRAESKETSAPPHEPFRDRASRVFTRDGVQQVGENALVILVNAFREGGIVWHSVRAPGRGARLLAVSSLTGFGIGFAVLFAAGLLHAITGIRGPWIDMSLKTAWVLVGVPIALWKAARCFREGWFR